MSRPTPQILELGMHFDPSRGGADRYFAGLVQGLQSSGENIAAAAFGDLEESKTISLDQWRKDPSTESPRILLGPEGMGLWKRRAALRRLGRHLPGSYPVLASHFALYAFPLLGQLKTTSLVTHFHGPWALESAGEKQKPWVVSIKRLIEHRVYASAKRLIALSQAFRDILIQSYAVPPEKIAVIPGGVDTVHFHPLARDEARCRMNWPAEKKIVFCVRRMVHRMGLENLIDAFSRVAAEEPDAILIFGGKGPLLTELQNRTAALGLARRIIFQGFIPDQDLPSAYSAADFSIVPSQALEGFGLITLESLACGTPVLVTPVGGLPETVSGLDHRLLLSGDRVEDLTSGMVRGFSPSLPSRELCRKYAEKNFAWPEIACRVMKVYQEAADDSLR